MSSKVQSTPPLTNSVAFQQGDRSFVGFMKRLTDPLVAQFMLLAVHTVYGAEFSQPLVFLAILTFSLTYPGTIPFRYQQIGLIGRIVGNWGLVVAVLAFCGWAFKGADHLDINPLLAWVLATPVAIYLLHIVSPYVAPRVFRYQVQAKAIVVGANEAGLKIAESLNDDPLSGLKVVAYFDDRSADRLDNLRGIPVAGKLKDLSLFLRENQISAVYLSLPMASQPRIMQLLESIRDSTASVYFVPNVFMYDLIQARVDTVGGMPILAVCESPFHGTSGIAKRWSDIVISLMLLIILSPIMLAIAISVKLTSPGPVLFRQKRYGLDSQQISVLKFRSMKVHDEHQVIEQASKSDPRTTVVGRFIRKTSLDELPQLFNVFLGSMSLVGPRPHAVSHNELYRKLILGYMVRHKVKPGITGWAQVNGARGETETVEKMQKRIDLDMHYLRHWSLQLDLLILLKTIKVVFRDQNAY
jgi:putative colanic acid biosysnthesis UDP-glucose lipid carrier transferase